MNLRLSLASFCAALCSFSPAFADVPVASGSATTHPTVLLIPFGPPGNTDYQLDAATTDFSTRLTEKKNFTVVKSVPMDVMDVSGSAGELCKKNGTSAIFVGTARHEQTHNIMWGTFPTHAEVRVSEIGCDGKVIGKFVGIGDKVQYWSNPAAAVTNVIQMALDQIISEMP